MNHFQIPIAKIQDWLSSDESAIKINGPSPEQWCFLQKFFFFPQIKVINNANHIIVCPNIEMAENIYDFFKISAQTHTIHYFPGLEVSPYGNILPSHSNLYQRFKVLAQIANPTKPQILICTIESLHLRIPTKNFFKENSFNINTEDILSPTELSKKLVSLGYSPSTTVDEPGTFSAKGEIFDIYPISFSPCRINYYDDMIENIYKIDLSNNKTVQNTKYTYIPISPSPNILINESFSQNLRKNIPMPAPKYKQKYEYRKKIFSNISRNSLFEEFPNYIALFFNQSDNIISYFNHANTFTTYLNHNKCLQTSSTLADELFDEFSSTIDEVESNLILPAPTGLYKFKNEQNYKSFFINDLDINIQLTDTLKDIIDFKFIKTSSYLQQRIESCDKKHLFIKKCFNFLKDNFSRNEKIIFTTSQTEAKKEIDYLIDLYNFGSDLKKRILFLDSNLSNGFFYPNEEILIISEADLFSRKQKKTKKKFHQEIDLFAERVASLKEGDFVIHSDHGIGKYLGLESIILNECRTDYLIIEYQNSDKIYVPVYKMNLVQKHADATSKLKPASLRTNKFNQLKIKAKKSAKQLAFDLLALQAERQSNQAFAFSPPDHEFKEFELAFPFRETHDQTIAIEKVITAMQKPRPMDFLVCGDVGFGKTEVAMRASFIAVLDKKQIAILVPTTILALQHYQSFIERFKNFPVNIDFISRFKTAKEVKRIKEKLELGQIDIIIGTQKLLHNSVKYKSLGLVIVDEEQKFGVKHKEKLKLYKATVDFITLTATPIPRTLQLAFLGLRDLALIQTPPPKRQSIRTYIIKEDDATIQTAIKKEIKRGGQVFFVHNRVRDIESVYQKIQKLVPEASIIIGHGQLPESTLEKRMAAFYSGKYQILLCTTIIESGLDIPNANTMIINRADNFGLAQLHQLRGRIGRSDRKAYAYFVIPPFHNISVDAENRLKALQTYTDMGSGFSLASCDLELRGAGDILGGNQSGHVESIGLELYMELLQEAISELKGEQKTIKKNIEISTPYPTYIPNHYIQDSAERLKLYKKLSNCYDIDNLDLIKDDTSDIFGQIPKEFNNLFSIIKIRIQLQSFGLNSIQTAGNIISLSFDKNILSKNSMLHNSIVEYFLSRPKKYQFTPEFKVIYKHNKTVTTTYLQEFSETITKGINQSNNNSF